MKNACLAALCIGLYSLTARAEIEPALNLAYSTALEQRPQRHEWAGIVAEQAPAPVEVRPLAILRSLPELPFVSPEQQPAAIQIDAGQGAALAEADDKVHASPQAESPPVDLWDRVRRGYKMPELQGDLVLTHQQWYLNRPDYLRRMVERSRRYLHHIVVEIESRGMPTELAFLPMVESAYNPMAYSRSHASGLWQFIPSTGKNYKLKQDTWVDERRDIVASTTAALDYLQNLHVMHDDWFLALASYNWGEGAVSRAVKKNAARGLPTDYEALTMPAETRNYVPKLQALKNIFSDRALLAALEMPEVPDAPYFATLEKLPTIDVKLAANLAEIPVEEFKALNPEHNLPVIKGDSGLLLPRDKINTFLSNLEEHQNAERPLASWTTYTVRSGESLEKLAPRFGISLSSLRAANGIRGRLKVKAGHTLLVPARASELAVLPGELRLPAAEPESSARVHVVVKGDTVLAIARRYGIRVDQLRQGNGLQGNRIQVGQRLRITGAGPAVSDAQARKTSSAAAQKKPKTARYKVRRGDTLYSIARRFDVELDALRRWNEGLTRNIQPGQTLTIVLAQN